MNISIRHAKVEDAHVIAEQERKIAEKPGFFCSQPSELTDVNVVSTILLFQRDKTGIYLVAECDGNLVGHAFLEPFKLQSLRHVADLNLAVSLEWQGKGVGTKLLQSIIDWAKTANLEKIQLNVRASNTAAISLYRKMGFIEEGRLKNRVKLKEGYLDDIIMGLDLINTANNISNKKTAETYAHRVWDKKEIDAIDEFFDQKCIIHSLLGDFLGPASMKKVVQAWLEGFPDLVVKNTSILSEKDLVMIQWQAQGSHQGEFKGIKPTGKTVFYGGVTLYRICEGKIVEYWAYLDMQHLLKQMATL